MHDSSATPAASYLCQRCANCCRWPGDIWVTGEDIVRISRHLDMKEHEFIQKFTRLTANRRSLSLVEKQNGECVFLKENDCTIQPVKPEQCSGFPNKWNFPGWREVCEAIPVAGTGRDNSDDGPAEGETLTHRRTNTETKRARANTTTIVVAKRAH